jgi:hypothetical protein
MIKAMNTKAYEQFREGMKEGMDTAYKYGKRVHFRAPWTYSKPSGWKSAGWMGLGLLSIAAMAIGAWLYFRKRKEVADHYTMGEGPAQAREPEQTQVDGQMAPAGRRP